MQPPTKETNKQKKIMNVSVEKILSSYIHVCKMYNIHESLEILAYLRRVTFSLDV